MHIYILVGYEKKTKIKKKTNSIPLSQIENLQAENPLLRKDFWHGQKLMSLTE